jgi:branched-chain amino acid transport system permease protein
MVQVTLRRPELRPMSASDVLRRLPLALTVFGVAIALIYILFVTNAVPSSGIGNWRTTNFGSAISDPTDFLYTVLDSVTFAGLLFIVASGFTLIFGLMRTVNMAHGSFFLIGGYIAYDVQQSMTTSDQCCTQYSVIFTFALLAFVLALRPLGLFGRPA